MRLDIFITFNHLVYSVADTRCVLLTRGTCRCSFGRGALWAPATCHAWMQNAVLSPHCKKNVRYAGGVKKKKNVFRGYCFEWRAFVRVHRLFLPSGESLLEPSSPMRCLRTYAVKHPSRNALSFECRKREFTMAIGISILYSLSCVSSGRVKTLDRVVCCSAL